MTDPIADLLTRIRNAYMTRLESTQVSYSKIKHELIKILKTNHFIQDFKVIKAKPSNQLKITLKYSHSLPAITQIKRLSKPGRRLYIRVNQIKPILSGKGIIILSTSQGLLTGLEAKKKSLGGELICKLW